MFGAPSSNDDSARARIAATLPLLVVLAALFVALTVRLPHMSRGLGQDELFTAVHFVEVRSIRQTLAANLAFNNHVLYSAMARAAQHVAGRSESILRAPALLLGLATIPLLFVVGRPLVGAWGAAVASLLLALSPAHIAWSTEARGYSALIFFTLLSTHYYLRLRASGRRRDAVGLVAAGVLSAYAHLYGVFVAGVQALAAAGRARSTRRLAWSFLSMAAITFILYLPLAPSMLRDLGQRGHGHLDPSFPWRLLRELTGTHRPVLMVLLIAAAAIGWGWLRRSRRDVARYFAALLVVPLVVMWLVLRPFDLYPRFFAYWLPVFLLLVAAGLCAAWDETARAKGTTVVRVGRLLAVVILAAVAADWALAGGQRVENEGYREASQAVLTTDPSVAFCAIGGARSVWQYYIKRPLATPESVVELRALARRHPEVRCVYYEADWQSPEQTEIARFLRRYATWATPAPRLFWFIYRPGPEAAGS